VREFCELAFAEAGMPLAWRGSGKDEQGINEQGKVVIEIDAHYYRPTEVDLLLGDATLAKENLGWQPRVTFRDLVKMMTHADLDAIEHGK
jgi:GDPmannose 4,6-dehydratase